MAIVNCEDCGKPMVGIHTCTPKRWKEWVSLTDEEILTKCESVPDYDIGNHDLIQFARAIEAAHGIKD